MAAAASVVAALVAALAVPVAVASEGRTTVPTAVADPADWRSVLEAAVDAAQRQPFHGRVIVASFDTDGPNLLELDVQRSADGDLRVGRSQAWAVGRSGDSSFLLEPQAGSLLRLGGGERLSLQPGDVGAAYDVVAAGSRTLPTGPATMLQLTRGQVMRERLFVDAATSLIVRRETYDLDGAPRRLVAFTELDTDQITELALPDGLTVADAGTREALSDERLDALAATGWVVPEQLPGGFTLASSSTIERGGAPSLHLVYTDGLYTLSLYEQSGRLDDAAMAGAAQVAVDEGHVYRWPGSEPERVVWSAQGRTFTAVSDAPRDVVATAIAALPQRQADSLPARLVRGLSRVAGWMWPFA